ncbi:low molecular weight protein-tyrosine-phosphatase [soil metagenome]
MRFLMVCLGNICRSPLAHGILEAKIAQHGLPWTVDSAGTSGWHSGGCPDGRSMAVAKKYGLDISGQCSRQFRHYDFEAFDVIYVMDRSNLSNVLALAATAEERAKVKMILNEIYPGQNKEVPDPYYDDNGFEEVYDMLERACEAVVRRYKN